MGVFGKIMDSLRLSDNEDDRVIRYLKGETIDLRDEESVEKGWVLICVDNYPLGFGKAAGGSVKNKYLAGWRWM